MARQGREFELLIKKIEETLLPENAVITSPDFITDKITGQNREVDISIRSNIGTIPILIVIECRDRQGDEDTTWIEQLHTKTCDINANKIIAVSSSGFSGNAIKKGIHYGIETRTFNDITLADIKDWCNIEFLVMYYRNYQMLVADFTIENMENLKGNPFDGVDISENFLVRTKDNVKVGLKSAFQGIAQANDIWASIPTDNSIHRKTINVNFSNPEDRFQIENNGTIYPINAIKFVVDMRIEPKNIPISKITSYNSQDGPIAQSIEFEGILPNRNNILKLVKTKDGHLLLSLGMENKK
jgi:hypothetical protein